MSSNNLPQISPTTTLLGEIVGWDLPTTTVHYSSLVNALSVAGLDPKESRELSPRSVFSRACRDMKRNRQIDIVETTETHLKFQFTSKVLDAGEYSFQTETFVSLCLNNGDIQCTDDSMRQLAQEKFNQWKELRQTGDITRLIQRLFSKNADLFPCNSKGVFYFVPVQFTSFIVQVEKMLDFLGGKLERWPIPAGTDTGDISVRNAVQMGLDGLIKSLNDRVDTWSDSTRNATMEHASEQWTQIRHKIATYDHFLGNARSQLHTAMARAKNQMDQKIRQHMALVD